MAKVHQLPAGGLEAISGEALEPQQVLHRFPSHAFYFSACSRLPPSVLRPAVFLLGGDGELGGEPDCNPTRSNPPLRMERKAKAAVSDKGSKMPIWVRATREISSPTQMRAKSRRAPQPQVGGGFQVLGVNVKFHKHLVLHGLGGTVRVLEVSLQGTAVTGLAALLHQ